MASGSSPYHPAPVALAARNRIERSNITIELEV
jgi:hypothetical protein